MNEDKAYKFTSKSFTVKSEDFSLQSIINILNLTIAQRSSKQNFVLQEFTKTIRFFQKLTEENGEYVHKAVCERLRHEFVQQGQYVFHINSFGSKFYVIITGKVTVWVPVVFDGETEMKQVTTLTDGAGFGELALIKDQPRSASILCEHDTHFAILSKEDYMSIIGKVEARKLEVFIEFLHDIPIFRPWTKKKLEVLTFYLNKQMFKRKQEVFRIGSRPEYVYIVQDGEFELTQPFGRKDRKENFTLKVALLGRGEVFGDEEVMKNAYHTLNCVCYSTFGTLLAIKAEDFKIKVHSHELLNEFKKKDLSKHMLRSTRIESFRNYLTVAKDDEEEKIIRSSISSPFSKKIPNPIHKRDHTPTFLTPEKIERIKKKALGRIIFSDISPKLSKKRCQFLLSRTPENNIRDSSKNIAKTNEIKISPMRCHRPGGYYIGKLKKSWKGLKIIHS